MKQTKDFGVFSNKNILIIGGQGFVGQVLIQKLKSVNCKVSVFDKHIYKRYKNISHIRGDVTKALDVTKAVRGMDIIIDLAALRPIESMQRPVEDMKITALGAIHILEACKKINKNIKVIFFGSSLEYGPVNKLPVSEINNPFNPGSLYGVHKLAVSHYSRIYHSLYGVKSTVLRFSHIYGPEEFRPGKKMSIVNLFIHQALKGKDLHIFGTGSQQRDFLYVDDALDAVSAALKSNKASGNVFNIGSGTPYSIKQVAEIIIKIIGRGKIIKKNWPQPFQKIEQGTYYTNYSKAKKILGWFPKVNLEEGLKNTVLKLTNELQNA